MLNEKFVTVAHEETDIISDEAIGITIRVAVVMVWGLGREHRIDLIKFE